MSERKQKWKFNVEMCYPFDVNMIEQIRVQSEYRALPSEQPIREIQWTSDYSTGDTSSSCTAEQSREQIFPLSWHQMNFGVLGPWNKL